MTSTRPPASVKLEHGPIFSWHRTHAGLIFTSGHAAVDVEKLSLAPGSFADECRSALGNLARTLASAGSNMDNVLQVTVYLTDMTRFPMFNQIYAEFFPGDEPPARTCVEVRRLPYHFQVEIQAIAAAGES